MDRRRIRRLALPNPEWIARRRPTTVVDLGPAPARALAIPIVFISGGAILIGVAPNIALRVLGGIVVVWGVAVVALRHGSGNVREAAIVANGERMVLCRTKSGPVRTKTALSRRGRHDDIDLELYWRQVLAASIAPTGAPWWSLSHPRIYLDLYLTQSAEAKLDAVRDVVVDHVPPAPDLPPARLRFTVPRRSQQNALNMLRWCIPEALIDPSTGGSALQLEPDGDPWPDTPVPTPGSLAVPIPPGPILGLPAVAIPPTEWAPPEGSPGLTRVDMSRRPDFAPPVGEFRTAAGASTADSTDSTGGSGEPGDPAGPMAAGATPRRVRPPHVRVFGKLGRLQGGGLAWRVGWLLARFVIALFVWLIFVFTLVVELAEGDAESSGLVGLVVVIGIVSVPLWRYSWRIVAMRAAGTDFVAFTPGGVRAVDAVSYASIPWRVIRAATLRTRGRRAWLCLAIDAAVPADISWAVLEAPHAEQVVPNCTVLHVRMPLGEANAGALASGLDIGGSVPFDPHRWPTHTRG